MTRVARVAVVLALLPPPIWAQAFTPPSVAHADAGTRLGLYGFGVRAGADLANSGQLVLGFAIDAGSIGVSALRVRPSVELGFANGLETYTGSLEGLYRLKPDGASLGPYVGGGPGVRGHARCQADSTCPALWLNVVMGLEIRFRPTFNWLVEYHGLDLFQHGRLELGLTTRRGS